MIDITKYGYPVDLMPMDGSLPARITAVHRGAFDLICPQGEARAKLRGNALRESKQGDRYPAVGDYAHLTYNDQGDSQITKLLPRITQFSRNDFSGHAVGYVKTVLEQVVAANFDHVLIVMSLNRDFNVKRAVRYLALARESGAKPCVVLTKADLADDREVFLSKLAPVCQGVPIFIVSSVTSEGIDELLGHLAPGETIVLLGSSGVGKSSLINAIEGTELMRVKAIREEDGRGRHTTTHRQLILLSNGIVMIDTPGMRELGMLDAQEGLLAAFPEILERMGGCRFGDCSHTNEPGCAILAAREEGAIAAERWESYVRLLGEMRFVGGKAPQRRAKGKPVSPKRAALRYRAEEE